MPDSGIWFYTLRKKRVEWGKKVKPSQNQTVLTCYEVKMLQVLFLIAMLSDSGLNNVDVKRSNRSALPNEIWVVKQTTVHSECITQ